MNLTCLIFSLFTIVQPLNPVSWEFQIHKVDKKTYEVLLIATIAENWAIYSQFMSDEGPIPTEIEFRNADQYEIVGKAQELGDKIEGHDPFFDIEVIKFKHKVTFSQKIILTGNANTVDGSVTYMTCDDERCLPPKTVDFQVKL